MIAAQQYALGASLLLGSYVAAYVIYNIFFHPLRHFPGPKLFAATPLARHYLMLRGTFFQKTLPAFHEKYGEVVRVGPNEITFANPAVWTDALGHGKARSFEKDRKSYILPPEGVHNIVTANGQQHIRLRRSLAHAFSDRALRAQEGIINGYVELLMQRLRVRTGESLDLVRWYNFCTFDVIGDLAFGEPFGGLKSSGYHPWVAMIFASIRAATRYNIFSQYLPFVKQIMTCMPGSGFDNRIKHIQNTNAKLGKRLESDTDRPDFTQYITKENKDGQRLSRAEMQANASVLIIAGSETTATVLSGTTYYLLKNPDKMKKLVDEIRGSFSSTEEMTTEALARCHYLTMALQEGMRIYPVVPAALPRRCVVDDATVAGYRIPKGMVVSLSMYSLSRSPRNFAEPHSFVPERWESELDEKSPYVSDNRLAVQPFSFGPRNCIGQNLAWLELRLILGRILFEFDMQLQDDGFNPEHQDIHTLWNKPSLNIVLTPRAS